MCTSNSASFNAKLYIRAKNRGALPVTETLGTITSANVVTDTTIKLDSDA